MVCVCVVSLDPSFLPGCGCEECWVPIVRALICELSSGGCAEDGD